MIISEWRSDMPEVPLVSLHDAAECGAGCHAMILGFHGTHVPLDELLMEGPLWISRDNRLNDCLGRNPEWLELAASRLSPLGRPTRKSGR
jgi:hypothetical protein